MATSRKKPPRAPAKSKPKPKPKSKALPTPRRAAARATTTADKLAAFAERAERVTAARTKKARALLARIRRLTVRIAEDFYDLAVCFHELRSQRHWATLGYATFEACVATEKLFDAEGARKMVAIIEAKVSREAALALGSFSAAYEALQITRATEEADTVDSLVESGARVAGTALAGSSVAALRAAKKAVRRAKGVADLPRTSAGLVRARKSAAALVKALREGAKLSASAEARATRPDPVVVLTLAVDDADALAAFLARTRR